MSDLTLHTIPPNVPFLDTLAAGLLARTDGAPEALTETLVLLPTRRACRSLREAFLRESGGRPLLLPRLQPIGDVDEEELDLLDAGPGGSGASFGAASAADLPPAVGDLRRRLLLTTRILERHQPRAGQGPDGAGLTAHQASWLAAELARLIDQVHTEGASFDDLQDLAPEELAEHWQETLDFLEVLTTDWPEILAAEQAIDPADRRDRLLRAQAAHWRDHPPAGPVIAAGSTGTIPATADLLGVIAGLPRGEVILPGLDRWLDEAAWTAVGGDATHPQYGMHHLLSHLGVAREAVTDWPDVAVAPADRHDRAPAARVQLVSEAFRPADVTDAWQESAQKIDNLPQALQDPHALTYVAARGPREEAGIIALALRRELEAPGRTAALVTPDRDLARRVTVALRRWCVTVDDSAGAPLAHTPPAAFLLLLLNAVADDFAPVPLMALLKHPFCAAGLGREHCLEAARLMERRLLRGTRPGAGLKGIRKALEVNISGERPMPVQEAERIGRLLDTVEATTADLAAAITGEETALEAILGVHIQVAEAMATGPGTAGPARLWAQDDGEAAARFVDELAESGAGLALPPADYPALFDALLAGRAIRPRYGAHPRLAILGPLEARLLHHDLIILGGLNEGTWPALPAPDPWMSREMRRQFGLQPPERRIGLSAHDVARALCHSRVMLTRAERVEGTPTTPSRWLLRLKTVLEINRAIAPDGAEAGVGGALLAWPDPEWSALYERLDAWDGAPIPVPQPRPCPPVELRPRDMGATAVETWRRNPYGIYAQRILRLRKLDPLDAAHSPRDRGNFIHDALDRFLAAHPKGALPVDAREQLIAFGEDAFAEALESPEVRAFWWPRFERIAGWFVEQEAERRTKFVLSLSEVQGHYEAPGPAGPFMLKAKADRIELDADGNVEIGDYKTGSIPNPANVELGYAPQLPLEALIARSGTFDGLPKDKVRGVGPLRYWKLSGDTETPGKIEPAGLKSQRKNGGPGDWAGLIDDARDGLHALVAAFDNEETPYTSRPRSVWAPPFDDYEHLARVLEWTVAQEQDA